MDILDIDEVLKDDSFCLLEVDNEQDDINNILQQWRRNGCANPEIKVDTRTFTRPKRRSAQNLDASFLAASRNSENAGQNIHLKVGGLVTSHMQKSFLQDTSPPSSISSSMDASSIDRMGNSLITSNDFTNVSFFKTTDAEVLSDAQIAGYTFDDVIKDRKALESLSLSGDSAIIKDCNIAQIDEMTYLSKTNSGNSTMQNSTESMLSGANDTFTMLNQTTVVNGFAPTAVEEPTNVLNKTFGDTQSNPALDDLISNTTMTLVDSTHLVQSAKIGTESNLNSTFSKTLNDKQETPVKSNNLNSDLQAAKSSLNIMNRTFYKEKGRNETFDMLEEANIEFPLNDNLIEGRASIAVQSTPQRSISKGLRSGSLVSQTPPFKCIIEDDVNISPIVPVSKNEILDDDFQLVDETKPYSDKSIDQLERYLESLSTNSFTPQEQQEECFKNEKAEINDALRDKVCFSNGIEMLADEKNEAKFDDMLEKLAKSVCLEESIKMRRSIDNIKKKHALLAQDKSSELNVKSNETSVELSKSSLSSSSSSERLLSRRSRLYDDVQVMKSSSECENKTISADDSKSAMAKTDRSIVPNSSYIVESKTDKLSCVEATENIEKGDEATKNTRSKLDRIRDPERFKTIRIFKKSTDNEIIVPCIDQEIENAAKETEVEFSADATYNAQDVDNVMNTTTTVFNNNKSEVQPNIMYQTYKKPKSQIKPPSVNECAAATIENSSSNLTKPRSLSRPKYISGIAKRESIFSGDALPKANSAGDIHRTYNNPNININNGVHGTKVNLTKLSSNTGTIFTKTTSKNELKSPMGTKAKSFTNLTGGGGNASFGFSSASRLSIAKPSSQPSLSKVKNIEAGLMLNNREKNDRTQLPFRPISNKNSQINDAEKNDKCTFKVPPPVSNLRMPNSRKTGLVRPSSGFYVQQIERSEPDSQTGRYSSSNSLSSTSSRGSIHDTQPWQCTNGYITEKGTSKNELVEPSNVGGQKEDAPKSTSNTARSGIPKPSGIRPPSAIRRSGLPRPSSVIRR